MSGAGAEARPGAGRLLLFVINDAGFLLSHRLNIARAARAAGWEVRVAAPVPPEAVLERLRQEGIRLHPLPFTRSRVTPLGELRALAALWRLLRRLRPQVVHAVTIKPVLYSGFVAPWAGVPALVQAVSGLGHVFISRGPVAAVRRRLVRFAYRAAFRHPRSRVILQNPDDHGELGFALRPGQAVLIPGAGVDSERFAPVPEPEGEVTVVLPARLLWAKGVGEFVEAARLLRERGVKVRMALVGESDPGNPAAVPTAQVEEWAASGDVEWWGRREDMPQVFADCHLVCLPSYREGLPKALLEAASCGRAIVTNDVPGCREAVHHGDNGLLVPARDAAALAEALERLIRDPVLRAEMGACGRRRVLERFADRQVVGATLRVYEELAGP